MKPAKPKTVVSDEGYRKLAKAQHVVEGECEIDPEATVSRSEDGPKGEESGAYVQAWVWVRNPHADD